MKHCGTQTIETEKLILRQFKSENADREWLWFISQNRRKRLAEDLIPLITGKK